MLTYDLFTVTDEMIELEDLKEVTSSKLFIRENEPDPEGLASYEIFGYPGTDERKNHFAYINLNDIFVHPHVLFELKSIKNQYLDLINGFGEFYVKDGDIERVTEDMNTDGIETGNGAAFLKTIWSKLRFTHEGQPSGIRFNRIRFIKSLDIDQIFMDKLIVMPPFYRDVDMSGSRKNEFNSIYISLINLASTAKSTSDLFGFGTGVTDTYRRMNQILIDFHEQIVKMYGGRKGFIHKYVMGKAIDYAARLVISCLDVTKANKASEMAATFDKSLIPMFAAIKCFAPFIVNGVNEIVRDYLQGSEYIIRNVDSSIGFTEKDFSKAKDLDSSSTKKGSAPRYERVKLASDWQQILTVEYIYNLIELYHESPEHRLDLFTLPLEDGGEVSMCFYVEDNIEMDIETKIVTANKRLVNMRLIHLFYMACMDKISHLHVYLTRYPIEDQNSTYPTKVNIIPYKRTARLTIGTNTYDNFPIVDPVNDMKNIESMFTDSLTIFPAYLAALGADFDGDQMSMVPVFTEEANADAEKWIMSVGNMTALNGLSTRSLGTLAQHVIHALTY